MVGGAAIRRRDGRQVTWHLVMKQGRLEPQYHGTRLDDTVQSYRFIGPSMGWKTLVDLESLFVRIERDNVQIFVHERLTERK